MNHEPTAYHRPIDLAAHRATRRVRAGAFDEFTFGQPVKKHGPRIETADERVERLMANLRVAEGTATRWERRTVAAFFALCAVGIATALFHFLRF